MACAELFARLSEDDFARCPYHQADDWPAITKTVLEHAQAERDGDTERAATLHAAEHLSPGDRTWARRLMSDHLWWDSGDRALTNGQHRLCALRAAGAPLAPVYGRHLATEGETEPALDARDHTRATVHAYWTAYATGRWGDGPIAERVGRPLARYPTLRHLLRDDGQ